MQSDLAVARLSALGQESRLAIFRMLVQAGPEGVAAGAIADRLAVPRSSLSANLTILSHAGLIRSRRYGRLIIYVADYAAMAELLAHLMEDCCGGHPEVCAPLNEVVTRAACCADTPKEPAR